MNIRFLPWERILQTSVIKGRGSVCVISKEDVSAKDNNWRHLVSVSALGKGPEGCK